MTLLRLAVTLLALAWPGPALATDGPPAAKRASMTRVMGYANPRPVYRLTLGRGQNAGITQPRKITRGVSGDPTIVEIARFTKASPTLGLRALSPGVTNVLVWTSDAQVHTYRVTVK